MTSCTNGLIFDDEDGPTIAITKGKFVTQDSLKYHQQLQREEDRISARLKGIKARRKKLEDLFIEAHKAGKRSARGDVKHQLEVNKSTTSRLSWRTHALDLAGKLGLDPKNYEETLKETHKKTKWNVKVT